jgi:hypothetical protein
VFLTSLRLLQHLNSFKRITFKTLSTKVRFLLFFRFSPFIFLTCGFLTGGLNNNYYGNGNLSYDFPTLALLFGTYNVEGNQSSPTSVSLSYDFYAESFGEKNNYISNTYQIQLPGLVGSPGNEQDLSEMWVVNLVSSALGSYLGNITLNLVGVNYVSTWVTYFNQSTFGLSSFFCFLLNKTHSFLFLFSSSCLGSYYIALMSTFLNLLFLPLGLSFMMPVFISNIVREKQEGLIEMSKMVCVSPSSSSTFVHHLTSFLFPILLLLFFSFSPCRWVCV